MAKAIRERAESILSENRRDMEKAKKAKHPPAFLDRLLLDEKRVDQMAKALEEIAALPDPVGEVMEESVRPNGLRIRKVRVPIGVILMIYESRPNVTAEAAGLCLKSGNAVILRGGSEAARSNAALAGILREALSREGLPEAAIQVVPTASRAAVGALLKMDRWIDLVIPRGGEKLIEAVRRKSRVPVLAHGKGVCHVYVDEAADLRMAEEIAFNAKVQRPGVCNAMETLLVHRKIAPSFLPGMIRRYREAGVEIRGCPQTRRLAPSVKPAKESDWSTEYLDKILSVKVVDSLPEAVDHIRKYGSAHSDSIVTGDEAAARRFLSEVDSAAVFWNASTRFSDGGEFGMGAEIGISTQKLHARGPMGLRELTSYKFVVVGSGQVRS